MKNLMIRAFLIMLAIPAAFVLLTSMKNMTENDNTISDDIKITDLPLNRKAVKLTGDKKKEFPLTQQGFLWDKGDSQTKRWRPQGITGMVDAVSKREFVITSWYGRPPFHLMDNPKGEIDVDYKDRGARISIVDVTQLQKDASKNNYRHVLLVDKNMETFYYLHAGGIALVDGKLHVADSRKGYKCIRTFDINKIKKVTTKIHKYEYVLIEEYNYKMPITPSYLSYDKDRKELLTGTFREVPSDAKPNLITWFKAPKNATEAQTFNEKAINIYRLPNKYKKIQGMTSMKDPEDATKQILWLSTSYTPSRRSNLYRLQVADKTALPSISAGTSSATNPSMINPIVTSKGKKYPPGLEDAHVSDNQQLWLLTEFYYWEGMYYSLGTKNTKTTVPTKKTRRGVFAIPYNSGI